MKDGREGGAWLDNSLGSYYNSADEPASGKVSSCQCQRRRDRGLIPGSGRSPGGGFGNPLQYSCLENTMDRGAWWVLVHGIAKSWTQLRV